MKEHLKQWLADTSYWCGRAAGKVILVGTYVFVTALAILGLVAMVAGVMAIDSGWDFSDWRR